MPALFRLQLLRRQMTVGLMASIMPRQKTVPGDHFFQKNRIFPGGALPNRRAAAIAETRSAAH